MSEARKETFFRSPLNLGMLVPAKPSMCSPVLSTRKFGSSVGEADQRTGKELNERVAVTREKEFHLSKANERGLSNWPFTDTGRNP
jgi:hypothetical protein